MNRTGLKTMEFLSYFKIYESDDIKTKFGDIFSEFIHYLNDADLSDETLNHLNELFIKDMKMFFEALES